MPSYDFSGSVAVVTGGSMGNGKSHALNFAEAGADVALFDVATDEMESVVESIQKRNSQALGVECDVTEEPAVKRAVEEVVDVFGSIDILVNNAGITEVSRLIELDESMWNRAMDINLKGTWLCSKHTAREMIDRTDRGAIVNTASTLGHVGTPGMGHYAASKYGVRGVTETLAAELARYDIRVNAVSPTGVKTPGSERMAERFDLSVLEEAVAYTGYWNTFDPPDGRVEPQDVSEAVLWLASDAARYVSGVSLPVNAGMSGMA